MTPNQWEVIRKSENIYDAFYDYWTIKESIIKADGRGLSIPLTDIHINGNTAILYQKSWFLEKININPGYRCHLALSPEGSKINLMYRNFN